MKEAKTPFFPELLNAKNIKNWFGISHESVYTFVKHILFPFVKRLL